jgi:DNA-binding NtrC family response regulator
MHVLFFHTNAYIEDELRECLGEMESDTSFVTTTKEAIACLHRYPIDLFFLEFTGIAGIKLLTYANSYFPHIRVLLTAEDTIREAVSTIQSGKFEVLQEPLALGTIRNIIQGRYIDRKNR